MQLLSIKDFDVSVKGHFLFHIKQLNIEVGEKIALVGANASGKSTFLKTILSAKNKPAKGKIFKNGLWAYFAQKSNLTPELKNMEQVSRWDLYDIAWRENTNFSGGEQVRLRLADIFSTPHDILVLDEPTAHLDKLGLEELKRQLANENTYIIVSHDRTILNEFCERILVIQENELIDFSGSYDEWKEWSELDKLTQLNKYEQAIQEKKRLLGVIADQKRKATKTQKKPKNLSNSEIKQRAFGAVGKSIGGKQKSLSAAAKNTEKRIRRLGNIEKPKTTPKIRPKFDITDPPQNKIIVEIANLSFAYPQQEPILKDITIQLKRNIKTALIGKNGVGKSTLLKLIRDGNPNIRVVPKAKFGWFSQNFENISMDKTILENIHATSIQDETINRNILFRMGFPSSALNKKAKVLSGGELTKLSFAKLFLSDFNVLLIDEPSNYLDIPSYEAIEELLLEYEGSMLFCSHDEYFIKTLAEETWNLEDGSIIANS